MNRYFSTAGPVKSDKHYLIPPLNRVNLPGILTLISQEKYFVLHAPRQTGKTTLLMALMDHINNEGKMTCLYVNVESAQTARENIEEGIRSILNSLAKSATKYLNDSFLQDNVKHYLEDSGKHNAFMDALQAWCRYNKKPVVLLMDEIDSLVGDTLISVLRQLRSGYPDRPQLFPQSVILCGVRDVRDYRIHTDKDKSVITGGSAFNIKAESLRLGSFTPREVKELYLQHTRETGQHFGDDVFPLVWEFTEGQPWLVNALAYEVTARMEGDHNRKKTITVDMIQKAAENLILRRETHLDQLTDKLKEKRVQRVLEPILAGSGEPGIIPVDDIDYAVDLGLVVRDKHLRIANQIYREIIPRQLTYDTQLTITQDAHWYTDDDGRLNMEKLLTAFQDFFRKNFEHWVEGFQYAEAGAQLLVQAFLQRLVNGGGLVHREYGLGRDRTDLLVTWNHKNGKQEAVMELKIRYHNLETTIEKGLAQTWKYMDKCGTDEGYLLVFDRTPDKPWEEKIFKRTHQYNNRKIMVFGM